MDLSESTDDFVRSGVSRTLSLVKRLDFSFNTSRLTPNSMVLGNIGNDSEKNIELAVGNGEGQLYIYKGKKKYPWKRATGLGSVSCMALGDCQNIGANSLIVISVDGQCHLFHIDRVNNNQDFTNYENINQPSASNRRKETENLDQKSQSLRPSSTSFLTAGSIESGDSGKLSDTTTDPSYSHDGEGSLNQMEENLKAKDLPPRSSNLDNSNQLEQQQMNQSQMQPQSANQASFGVKGISTTIVHDDWVSDAPASSTSHLNSESSEKSDFNTFNNPLSLQQHVAPINTISHSATENQSTSSTIKDHSTNNKKSNSTDPSKPKSNNNSKQNDLLIPKCRWIMAGNSYCALIADIDEDGKSEIVIGSNNRTVSSYSVERTLGSDGESIQVLKLKNQWNVPGQVVSLSMIKDKWGRPLLVAAQNGGMYTSIDHRGSAQLRQFGNPSQISPLLGSNDLYGPAEIRLASRPPVSLDGSPQDPALMVLAGIDGQVMIQDARNKIIWKTQTNHQLFCLTTCDITQDGSEEIIASSWDGKTYIFDFNGNSVEIQFEERVRAFAAGNYSISNGNPVPCLIFITFTDHLYIYYDLGISSIPVNNPITCLDETFHQCNNLAIDKSSPWTRNEQVRLVRSIIDDSIFDEAALIAYRDLLKQRLAEPTS